MKLAFFISVVGFLLFSCDSQKNKAPRVSFRADWGAKAQEAREEEIRQVQAREEASKKALNHPETAKAPDKTNQLESN